VGKPKNKARRKGTAMSKPDIVAAAEARLQEAKGFLYDYRRGQTPNATHTGLRRAVSGFLNAARIAVRLVEHRDPKWYTAWYDRLPSDGQHLLSLLKDRHGVEGHEAGVPLKNDHSLLPESKLEVGRDYRGSGFVFRRAMFHDDFNTGEPMIGVPTLRFDDGEDAWDFGNRCVQLIQGMLAAYKAD